MTNLRKSYFVSVFVILALAFSVALLSQGVMARAVSKLELVVDDQPLGVPLPQDGVVAKKAIKAPVHPAMIANEEGTRPEARTASASTENGGETYATATVIAAVPYTDAGTNVGAAHDYDATLCGSADGAGDVVYSITPANNGFLYVSTCDALSDPGVDTKIWVVENGVTEIACNDDDPDCDTYASTLSVEVTAGTLYYIVVGAYAPGAESPFQINVDVIVPGTQCIVPEEITFPAADSLVGDAFYADLALAPVGNGTWTAGLPSKAWYWNFTAPVNGMYTFSWCDDGTVPLTPVPPTYPNGRYQVLTWPACGLGAYGVWPYPPVNGQLCEGGLHPLVAQFVMVAGTSHPLALEVRMGESLKGFLTVTWEPLPLLNDDCEDAEDLGAGDTFDNFGHNLGATRDGPGVDGCSPSDPSEVCADVWYVWEADATGFASFDMCSGETDNKMWVYRGDECLATNPREAEGCSDDGCGVGGGPSFDELPCVAGERFLVRIGGWFIEGDPTYGDCNAYGMGVFYLSCYVNATSVLPVNDNCVAVTPVYLTPGVMSAGESGTTEWAGWDCIPHPNLMPEPNVWHGFTIDYCANVDMTNCGMPDLNGGRAYSTSYPWAPLYAGCPCSGGYVELTACLRGSILAGTPLCTAAGYPDGSDLSRQWRWCALIPGDYFAPISYATVGVYSGSTFTQWFDYNVQFTATEIACAYCAATANPNSCPPVAGSTWIVNVDISGLHKVGIAGNTAAANDCHAYENNTALTGGKVYRGFSYPLTVLYGRNGGGALGTGDSADVWVDWNQNSGLAALPTEVFERTRMTRVGPNVTCTIAVPADAVLGATGATGMTLMRVRIANAADGNNQACGSKTWGEVEDFALLVADLECGDFDISGSLDATDIAFLRAYYFGLGPAPDFWQRGDIDGDGFITIADIIALADAAYRGGSLNCM